MTSETPQPNQKASAKKSIGLFLLAILLILGIRWMGFEPYVIPSGSMIPTLLVNDHILVTKFSFGLRWPFTRTWLIAPKTPIRGEIVVFRSVEKDDFYMIKRVIGLPGDKIEFTEQGELVLNGHKIENSEPPQGKSWKTVDLGDSPADYNFYIEKLQDTPHWVMYEKNAFRFAEAVHVVPEGKIFMMGDNRDRSRDSRFWGDLPLENLLGKAQFVWLSCSETVADANMICNPLTIRWDRFFHMIK